MNNTYFYPCMFRFDEYPMALNDVLGNNNPLKYIYGTIRCAWANNYDSFLKFEEKAFIENVLDKYVECNYTPVFNFSKVNLTKNDLKDEFSNYLLNLCVEKKAEIIVASQILYDYVKSKYPDLPIIASVNQPVVKFQNNLNSKDEEFMFYDNLLKNYDKVIIRPEFTSYIEQGLDFKDKDRIILIPNSACVRNCQYFESCWALETMDISFCKKDDVPNFDNLMLSIDNLENLSNRGYKNYLLVDNKQTKLFLYHSFNLFLFDFKTDSLDIRKKLKSKTFSYIKSTKFMSKRQEYFFRKISVEEKNTLVNC